MVWDLSAYSCLFVIFFLSASERVPPSLQTTIRSTEMSNEPKNDVREFGRVDKWPIQQSQSRITYDDKEDDGNGAAVCLGRFVACERQILRTREATEI